MRTEAQIRAAAARAGCRTMSVRPRLLPSGWALVGELLCPDAANGDPWAPARLLVELAASDARDPEVRSIGAAFRQVPARMRGAAIQAWVKQRVSYHPPREDVQEFSGPDWALRTGTGSCPEHGAALVGAIAHAAGLPSRLVFFTQDGIPVHVVAQLGTMGRWAWAETTVDARYGEHPVAAVDRLGLERADVDGGERVAMPKWDDETVPEVLKHPVGALGQPTPQAVDLSSFTLPSYIDGGDGTDFAAALVAATNGIADPLDALALMLHESGLEPFADNGAAVGIFQLDPYDSSLTGVDRATFKQMTAAEQMPFAGAFWKRMTSRLSLPLGEGEIYWVNFLPATVVQGVDDSYVFVNSDDTFVLPSGLVKSLPGVYTDNVVLDHGRKGFITKGDMKLALQDGANGHPKTYAYLAQKVAAAGGGGGGGGGVASTLGTIAKVGAVGAILVGIGFVGQAVYRALT